jgi:hypothetical protein
MSSCSRPALGRCGLLVAFLLVLSAPSSAEPITVTGGWITVTLKAGHRGDGISSFETEGLLLADGFRYELSLFRGDATSNSVGRCIFVACSPTDTIPIGLPILGQGVLTVGGVTRREVFNSPPLEILNTQVTLPRGEFSLDGNIAVAFQSFADPQPRPGDPFPIVFGPVRFVGTGTFTLQGLEFDSSGAPFEFRARYDFAPTPVPEPGTLVLLTSAICGIALRSRRQVRR